MRPLSLSQMDAIERRVRALVDGSAEPTKAEKRALLVFLRPPAPERLTAPRPRRGERARQAKKARVQEKRETKDSRTIARVCLRIDAMTRDGHRSVLSGAPDTIYDRLHMHHICGRGDESLETVAMVTETEHKAIHRGDLVTLEALATWCVRMNMQRAALSLSKRISKVREARAAERRAGGES